MSRKLMLLYSTLVAFVFYAVFVTYAILVNRHGYSAGENMVMGGIFGVGLGFSTFCLLKAREQMWRQLCETGTLKPTLSKRVRRLYQVAQVLAVLTSIYFVLYSMDPRAVENALLHILVLIGGVFFFFVLAAILQQKEKKARKQGQGINPELVITPEQRRNMSQRITAKYLTDIGWSAFFLAIAYILFVYFGSEIIPAMLWHVAGLFVVMVSCFAFVLFFKWKQKL